MIKRINEPRQLKRLARELGVRDNWHEPDEREVTARVFGSRLDNAGFWGDGEWTSESYHGRINSADAEELWVRIYRDDEPVADVNLATLLAMAAGGITDDEH